MAKEFSKKILKNGVRVIAVPKPGAKTVTVLALVEAGSKYETKETSGLSHFLEHMCFKGTEKRPRSYDISVELDALGAENNAFTSQEFTGYYAKGRAAHFKTFMEIIADIYLHSTLPAADIEKEKGVIVDEISMYEDMPQRHVQELFMELLYGDQPAGWNIAGTKESVRSFSREHFLAYKNDHYVGAKTVIVVSGGISERLAFAEAEKRFGALKKGARKNKLAVKESQAKPAIMIKEKKTDQTHLVVGVRTFGLPHKDTVVLDVLSAVLGRGMSSRLFQKLREEMGVGYYVRAYNNSYTDHGVLQVSTGVDTKRVPEVLEAIMEEFRKLALFPVGKDELAKAKQYMIGGLERGLEGTDDLAEFYGGQEVLRQTIKTPGELSKKIERVTPKDIQRVAKAIFVDKHINLAIVGPAQDERAIRAILKF